VETSLQTIEQAYGFSCASCGESHQLRRGEPTVTVADGVVHTVTPYWCPRCRYAPEQQAPNQRGTEYWVLRDRVTGQLVTDDDGTVERWTIRASAERFATVRRIVNAGQVPR
jgi:hypothetical protein